MKRRDLLIGAAPAWLARGQRRRAFIDCLQPAAAGGGFRMEGWWTWCPSVIRGEDGRYHMFASRWPHALSNIPHWLTNSEVVRAVAERPEGPYRFQEIVLKPRGEKYWDGRMTHNPTIHRHGDTYLLFYTGTTYSGPAPAVGRPLPAGYDSKVAREARANQRIGLATAKSVLGPWTRRDAPILPPRPGKWDAMMTTNPAPCVLPDGGVLLVYKSTAHHTDLLRMGAARARHFEGPYERVKDGQIFTFKDPKVHIEDAYVWRSGGRFELLMKDMQGGICGEAGGGVHATSPDGETWTISSPPKAYSRTVLYDNGTRRTYARVERPQLLIEDGRPTFLFLGVATGPNEAQLEEAWSIAIPLKC